MANEEDIAGLLTNGLENLGPYFTPNNKWVELKNVCEINGGDPGWITCAADSECPAGTTCQYSIVDYSKFGLLCVADMRNICVDN